MMDGIIFIEQNEQTSSKNSTVGTPMQMICELYETYIHISYLHISYIYIYKKVL